jgi:alpha-L-fucosidase
MRYLLVILVFLLLNCCRQKVTPPEPVGPVPSAAQLRWHEMEMNAFIHFTTNTFTGSEWGSGAEDPSVFSPTQLDADQWIRVLKEAGFKGAILTCKHHDGFCLWPSKYTEHSVKNSPYKNGKGDIVKEVAEACRRHGLKFGVYLSPWDRNHADYGRGQYIRYYRDQLQEVFNAYGPVFEMWFDGANGGTGYYGGASEKRTIDGATYYDWPATLEMVRTMEPEVIFFSDAGPGVRWVGNERGIAGETNWNTISPDTLYAGKAGIESLLNTGHEAGTRWIPAEVDVSIRPGWFYHAEEDSLVKSPEQLFSIYLTSVGRGSTLLLNVPPDRRGLVHERDVEALQGFKRILDSVFHEDLAPGATLTATVVRGDDAAFGEKNLIDSDAETFWCTDDGVTTASISISLKNKEKVNFLVLQEYIKSGQRIRRFSVDIRDDNGEWIRAAEGSTIGYKRIVRLGPVTTDRLRINIEDSKAAPVLSTVALY